MFLGDSTVTPSGQYSGHSKWFNGSRYLLSVISVWIGLVGFFIFYFYFFLAFVKYLNFCVFLCFSLKLVLSTAQYSWL